MRQYYTQTKKRIHTYPGRFGFIQQISGMIAGILFGTVFGVSFLFGLAFLTGRQVYYETSDSMTPQITKGSLLFVSRQDFYEVGDIITFRVKYRGRVICVTHRILQIERTDQLSESTKQMIQRRNQFQNSKNRLVQNNNSDKYITKGDANLNPDWCIVEKKQILGKVTEYIPVYGYICLYIKKYVFFIVFFLLLDRSILLLEKVRV